MTTHEDDWIAPKHDPFQPPDAEPDADTRERLLSDEEAAGDGEIEDVRRELDEELGELDDERPNR